MRIVQLLLIGLFLISCSEKKSDLGNGLFTFTEPQQIEQREIKDLNTLDSLNLDSLGLFTPRVLVKVKKGLVFLDRTSRTIVQTDNDLRILNTFEIPEGRGPGELGLVRRFDEKDGKIAFIDNGLKKLTLYSLEGKFLKDLKVSGFPLIELVEIINSDEYLIASTFATDSLYHLIDSKGNILKRIQSSKQVDNPMMFTAQLKVSGNNLYMAGYSEPVIKKYSLENGSLIYSKEMIDSYETTENYMSFSNGAGFTDEAIYGSMAIAIENGFFYSARHHNGKKGYKFLDVYSEDFGEYEFSYLLDNYINNESIAVDDDHLYTIETNSKGENLLMKYAF